MDRALAEKLRPVTCSRVYDTVAQAGISVEPWHNLTGKITPPQNPNFCYRWAFEGNGKILLFLWHSEIVFGDTGADFIGNARQARNFWEERSNDQRIPSLKRRFRNWSDSAQEMDSVLKLAKREAREVRVAIVHTKTPKSGEDERSSADYRELDPEPWHLVHYEMQDGSFHIRRGPPSSLADSKSPADASSVEPPLSVQMPEISEQGYGIGVADQFVGFEEPLQKEASTTTWERSALVRQRVLMRSGGCCEYCLAPGFKKFNGDVYLETHHIDPLSEGGADTVWNVIALCPNHHREAHYGCNSAGIKQILKGILETKRCEDLQAAEAS